MTSIPRQLWRMPRPVCGVIRWSPLPEGGPWYPAYVTESAPRTLTALVFHPDDRMGRIATSVRHADDPEYLTLADKDGGVWRDDPFVELVLLRLARLESDVESFLAEHPSVVGSKSSVSSRK